MAAQQGLRGLELKLEDNWSSEDVVHMLTPDLVGNVLLDCFGEMEPTIKMRTLIAFLGVKEEQLSCLQEHLPALLNTAENDKDEWVQVAAGLVRRKVLALNNDGCGIVSDTLESVLLKTVSEVVAQAKKIMEKNGTNVEASGVMDTPYSGPLEEQYISKRQFPRHGKFTNRHFRPRHDILKLSDEQCFSSPTPSALVGTATGSSGAITQTQVSGISAPVLPAKGPNLAKLRKTSLVSSADPSSGSSGLRAAIKPMALAHKQSRTPLSGSSGHLGVTKSGAISGGSRGHRANRPGIMMLGEDELEAIVSAADEKAAERGGSSFRSRGKGKSGPSKTGTKRKGTQIGEGSSQDAHIALVEEESHMVQQVPSAAGNTPSYIQEVEQTMEEAQIHHGGGPWASDGSAPHLQVDPEPIGGIHQHEGNMWEQTQGMEDEEKTPEQQLAESGLLLKANMLRDDDLNRLHMWFRRENPTPEIDTVKVKLNEEVCFEGGESVRETLYVVLYYSNMVWRKTRKVKKNKE
ncbi:unnamed protein product [Choristocarpus tenellus]